MILAYLLLLTGLTISAVAIYYSVVGLTAIFSAAAIPIIIMGSALEVGKLVCASWLKANWERAPRFMKYYMTIAVVVLMLITSMGIFGFLSKAHNDQTLVSGDVGSKIAIYDEKIKTAKENIEADRKQLKQMDEAVDQIMGRSSDEKGADKANAVRKSQQKDRVSIAKDIETQQKLIASLNDEAAPIRAEVRKVEAEVGPIKYIAAFLYGTAPNESMLEQAVTWIIVLIVIVFDPLAVIMLLAAQMTFAWTREQNESAWIDDQAEELTEAFNPPAYEPDDGPLTADQTKQINETVEMVTGTPEIVQEKPEETVEETELDKWNKMIEEAEREVAKTQSTVEERVAKGETYIDNEGNEVSALEESEVEEPQIVYAEEDGSKKKTYMIKDQAGNIQTKNRE
jgi:Tfp pilus assembly protein PilO